MVKPWKHPEGCAIRTGGDCNCSLADAPEPMKVDKFAMRRVAYTESGYEAMAAGDFCWLSVGPEPDRIYSAFNGVGRPSHFAFRDELRQLHIIPISPNKNESNGASWQWDGNLDVPTITPSILSFYDKPGGGRHVYWHGFVTKGRLVPCDDSPRSK